MNYEQTAALFKAMEAIETYSKLWQHEVSKDGTSNWDKAQSYDVELQSAREKLFNLVQGMTS